jgi:RimJ/RimL family protein N-acetyltransferase
VDSAARPVDAAGATVDLARWTTQARTRDGAPICIRPLRPDDRDREIAFIESLSPESRYFRLLTPLRVLPPHLVDQLMDIDYRRRMALVATVPGEGDERIVGVARYGEMDDAATAELGITVTDAWQRRGIASLLVTALMRYAREHGMRRIEGIVLPENHRMLSLAARLGFEQRFSPEDGLMHICRNLDD